MQNGVHRDKKPETEAKSKNRVMAKKLTSIKSVYPQTQPHRTQCKSEWEATMSSLKTYRILWPSVTTFKNILSNKKKVSKQHD